MTTEAPQTAKAEGWHGPFYFAPKDHRVWVRKREYWGYGWTFNFARPTTYAIIVGLIAVPIVVSLFIR